MSDRTKLTPEDVAIIREVIAECADSHEKIWGNKKLAGVKAKIKAHYRSLLEESCCYCCKNIHGEFKLVLDIEHILPKAHFKKFEFSPFNLSVACKRCNMNIKQDDTSFLKDLDVAKINPTDTANYKIIHPNLDYYYDHLCYETAIRNNSKMVKYTVANDSDKGAFTYEYFRLKELEIDTINIAQGIVTEQKKFSDLMPSKVVKDIEALLKELHR